MPFWFAIVVSSNPINYISARILYTRNPLVTMRIVKLEWIMLTTVASQNGIHSLSQQRENLGPQHCLTKCALENKLLNQNC